MSSNCSLLNDNQKRKVCLLIYLLTHKNTYHSLKTPNAVPVCQQGSKAARQQTSKPVKQQASKAASKAARQQGSKPKSKQSEPLHVRFFSNFNSYPIFFTTFKGVLTSKYIICESTTGLSLTAIKQINIKLLHVHVII